MIKSQHKPKPGREKKQKKKEKVKSSPSKCPKRPKQMDAGCAYVYPSIKKGNVGHKKQERNHGTNHP
jgi:hypothetical protein